jgi:PKD repeat protein
MVPTANRVGSRAGIRIGDLPIQREIYQDELEAIFGAGAPRYRPSVEALEQRELLTSGLAAPLRFDFGPAGAPVAPGYTGVPLVAYTQAQGYGWQSLAGLSAIDRHIGDALTTDFIRGSDATFLVDLPNGTYDVTPTLGDASFVRDEVAISAQGQQLASGLTSNADQFISPTYKVQVADGQLDLRFVDTGGTTPEFAVNGLDIVTAPVAHAGPNLVTTEGLHLTFAGSASGSSPLTYTWNFGDGATTSGTLTPSHVYADDGTYTATLTVTDALGISSQSSTTVTVNTAAPVANIGGSYLGAVAAPIAFAATATHVSHFETMAGFTYAWNFGDGTVGQGANVSHAYTAPGTYTVTVTVTDADGVAGTASTTASVQAIYTPTTGIYALGNPNGTISKQILSNANVDGIAVRATWDFLESSEGVYNWSYLDNQIAAAANAGKKISLSIAAGVNTPSWVYSAGAQSFTFKTSASSPTQKIPLPWDPVFLTKWESFIVALGQRYGSNPTISHLAITGINSITAETFLPHAAADLVPWQAAGYTRAKVEAAWQSIADTWSQAFAGKQLVMEMVPSGFPTIDANGNIFSNPQGGDNQIITDLINLGISRYGSQFVVQNNGLKDTWIAGTVTGLANQVTTGFQMFWFVTGDSKYLMNDGKTIDAVSGLQQAMNQAINGGARYLEIYQQDIVNANMQGVLATAHAQLSQTVVPIATITGLPAGPLQEGTNTITLGSAITDATVTAANGYTYAWTVTHNGQTVATGKAANLSFTATDSGAYVVSLQVTDAVGRSSLVNSQTIMITNAPPTITQFSVPLSLAQGAAGTFTAAATDPGPADTAAGFTYTWRFGNGDTATGSSVTYAYKWTGTFTVTLIVTDTGGASSTTPTTVTVTRPVHSPEGAAISLNASSFPAPGGVDLTGATYAWTVTKNGTVYATGSTATLTFTPNDLSSYLVTLTVTAKTGRSWTSSVMYAIDNLPPTITQFTAPMSLAQGVAATFSAVATDPGQADTAAGLTYTWKFGNGDTATGSSVSYTYKWTGTFTVTLTVTDAEGAKTTTTRTVTVTKPTHSPEGAAIALSASAFPAPSGVNLTGSAYAWTVTKNGTVYSTGSGANFTFTPNDLSNYVVTLTVTTKAGQSWTNSVLYVIDNLPPTITSISAPATATRGASVTFAATATDPGQADTTAGLTYTWSFGNAGGTVTGSSVSYTYVNRGTFTVILTVTDQEGAKTKMSRSITVS